MSKYMSLGVCFCEFTVCPGMCMCIYECLCVLMCLNMHLCVCEVHCYVFVLVHKCLEVLTCVFGCGVIMR